MTPSLPNVPDIPFLALLSALALLLLCGGLVHADITKRRIPDAYCVALAILASLWWVGEGGWPGLLGFLAHLLVPLVCALPLIALYYLRVLGAGDVKLILALLLWIEPAGVGSMLMVMALVGAVLAIGLQVLHRVFWRIEVDSVPYSLAIVAGALQVLLPQIRNVVAIA